MANERTAMIADHLPEYLIEALGLGLFMVSAGLATTWLEAPRFGMTALIPNGALRRALIGLAMGLTAVGIIYSRWGRRSGAHLNPAVTLTFLRLKRMRALDAAGYIIAQFVGGALGVLFVRLLLGTSFSAPPVSWIVTVPGPGGPLPAFAAEVAMSWGLMFVVLRFSAMPRFAPLTGLAAGSLVALYILFEAPLSGMSINPARTVASALPAMQWRDLWIYFVAPVLGMQAAAQWQLWQAKQSACAKLMHTARERCIHCGYEPDALASKARA